MSRGRGPVRVLLRETVAAARAQRIVSLLTLLVVLGATTTTLVTAGRAEGAQSAVLAQIEQAGIRTVSVHAPVNGGAPLMSDLVDRFAAYDLVESALGFGPATDVRAAANTAGELVALRDVYGKIAEDAPASLTPVAGTRQVWATAQAVETLGLPGRGLVRAPYSETEYLVADEIELPMAVRSWDPVLLAPAVADTGDDPAPINTLVIVARRAADVGAVTELVRQELADIPAQDLMVETSQELADAYGMVDGELTRQNRAIILGSLASAVAAVTVVVWGAAMIRRRDFGRRRALGATRRMILTLVVAQVALLSVAGAVLGAAVGSAWLWWSGDPLPDPAYVASLAVVVAATTAVMSAVPAWWAACRDPLSELRVP
ncbi:hypothetical protein LEP48_00755 [Isoptericola sp. NEAU-Y5]|uniref:ABC3 transporter permease C-terminal domain-containing protein n=1 Tax=Isoptericola luteus TaxID=2879484 RepID=A0ABS7Z9Z6_9MICO|nr:FtsX-like permease family protein [Isoptericola sp. NEAU-Y5]MCA5891880.1 hypothetical protein [Isoptericola sp. NEAU-Y5]